MVFVDGVVGLEVEARDVDPAAVGAGVGLARVQQVAVEENRVACEHSMLITELAAFSIEAF